MSVREISEALYRDIALFSRDIHRLVDDPRIAEIYEAFPYKWCKAASFLLYSALSEAGVEDLRCPTLVLGSAAHLKAYALGKAAPDGEHLVEHMWVQAGPLHIDLTRGQFDDKPEYREKPYIAEAPPFIPGCYYFHNKAGGLRFLAEPPYQPLFERFRSIFLRD